MNKYEVVLAVQKPAHAVGITNAQELAHRSGIAISTSYDLWNERTTRFDLSTIAKLCEALKCEVSAILIKRRRKSNNNGNKANE